MEEHLLYDKCYTFNYFVMIFLCEKGVCMIENRLKLIILLFCLILFTIVILLVRKKKLPVKYSIFWLAACLTLFLVVILPEYVAEFSFYLGFVTMQSLIVGVLIVILFLLSIVLTAICSEHKRKITILVQRLALIESELNGNAEK